MRELRGFWLGRRRYAEVHALQHLLFEERRRGAIGDVVLLLEHEPVITLGRGARAAHLLASPEELAQRGVDLEEIGRGGDVTLHAPGQLIGYPILDLSPDHRDVRRYVEMLAEVMRRVVEGSGVAGGCVPGRVGLWVDAASPARWDGPDAARALAKIGAIGVRISRWITMHGFALNLSTDLSLFRLIVPCGIREYPVTSLEALSGAAPSSHLAAERAYSHLAELLTAGRSPLTDMTGAELHLESFAQPRGGSELLPSAV